MNERFFEQRFKKFLMNEQFLISSFGFADINICCILFVSEKGSITLGKIPLTNKNLRESLLTNGKTVYF